MGSCRAKGSKSSSQLSHGPSHEDDDGGGKAHEDDGGGDGDGDEDDGGGGWDDYGDEDDGDHDGRQICYLIDLLYVLAMNGKLDDGRHVSKFYKFTRKANITSVLMLMASMMLMIRMRSCRTAGSHYTIHRARREHLLHHGEKHEAESKWRAAIAQ